MLLLLLACDDTPPPIPADLTVSQRTARIQALQDGRTDDADEAQIRDLLLGARGDDLLAVKQGLDRGTTDNLHHLVFSDIDDDSIRAEIIAHLSVAASRSRRLQVLSDIDDTLYANWVDARFPSGTRYPGILDLYTALSPDAPPTFISARPGDRAGAIEGATLAALADLGIAHPTLLAGDFSHLTSSEDIAQKKHRNFVEYSILYPEYDFVFLGDSGQGDAMLGRRMLASHPERVAAVLIHDVTAAGEGADGIHHVDTWLDAAAILRGLDLIDDDALARIAVRSGTELEAVAFEDGALRQARLAEHTAALAAAAAALSPAIPEEAAALAADLQERCARDQALRSIGSSEDIAIAGMLDTAFLASLLAAHDGFPRTLASPGAAHCAWLLLQHAGDLSLQRTALASLTEALPDGVRPADVALLTDRVNLRSGQPQVYGSQFYRLSGVYRPLPLEAPEEVDARRASVGLPPLAEYAETLASGDPFDLEPLAEIPEAVRAAE